MSENGTIDREFIIDVVGLFAGIVIFLVFSFLLASWEQNREQLIGTEHPGATVYLLIPVFVGFLTFGTVVLLRGVFSIAGVIITNARNTQQ